MELELPIYVKCGGEIILIKEPISEGLYHCEILEDGKFNYKIIEFRSNGSYSTLKEIQQYVVDKSLVDTILYNEKVLKEMTGEK